MKKIFLVAAMTLILGSLGTVFATDVSFTNGTTTGNTTKVKYSVQDGYTITIPSEFSLETSADVTKEISASNVFIANGKELHVKISGKNCADNKWYIVDENASTNKFEYTIKNDENADVVNNAVILKVPAGTTAGVKESFKFKLAGTVTKAGTYSDLLTFTASVENPTV